MAQGGHVDAVGLGGFEHGHVRVDPQVAPIDEDGNRSASVAHDHGAGGISHAVLLLSSSAAMHCRTPSIASVVHRSAAT